MGSFKRNGRSQGPNRRRNKSNPQRQGFPRIESLEDRRLMSGPGTTTLQPLWTPTSANLYNVQNGPMANLGGQLISIYQQWAQNGASVSTLANDFPQIEFQGNDVGVQVKSLGGDFSQFQTTLQNVGMQVTTSSAYYGLVDGWAPINSLPSIAEMAQTEAGQPLYYPVYHYQGAANNEAATAVFADAAMSQYNVTGQGVTVGAISDSVNQYNGGLSESYGTLDLNPSNPVNVISDGPAGSTDEGRAMLENIHDIAPGANLAFATAGNSDLAMNQAILALANTANANIIVDDVSFLDEPLFQDGVISQAVNTVTSQGVSYFSAAGNQANGGYLSQFRGVTDTITGVSSTASTYMNFNPNGGTLDQMPITTTAGSIPLVFQFDQPYQTQEPSGDTNAVTSSMSFYLLDSTGAVVASSTNNNVATQAPFQTLNTPSTPGTYYVVIQLVSGTAPGHVEFYNADDSNTLTVSPQFGSAGGTYYPTSAGHETALNTIGVGAVPWWSPAPYLGQNPLASEPFSSNGPGEYTLTPLGAAQSPVIAQNPAVTAPDGGNTSFFIPGNIINTSNAPPFTAGEPSTPTNLSQDLPSFFGTSSAAPNAAAVAALMKQLVPSLTPAQIRTGLIASASSTPTNGATPGTWDAEGGYGLINAPKALSAVDVLRVSSTNPAAGTTVTTAPSFIQVTFNKPVVFSTLSAADLTFTTTPTGVTVVVGSPIIDPSNTNTNAPTIIDYPIILQKAAGIIADGKFTFSVQDPTSGTPVVSEDGKGLVGSGPISFTLADTTAPTIVNTTISGRTVQIKFSKALDPNTVTLGNIFVLREGTNPVWPPDPTDLASYTNLNSDPRATISYNPLTFTVTLDYSNLPQTELPSDSYAIIVQSASTSSTGVTDLVGNSLDGYYTGTFPTGAFNGGPYDFIQNLGFEALQAPTITTFVMNPASDTGLPNDQNTNQSQPQFIGQIYVPFPGSVAGDPILVEFSGDNGGTTTLAAGPSGRGFVGKYDVLTTTTSTGSFTLTSPLLPEGFQTAVAVVVGQPDLPPLPGLSSSNVNGFRIDKTSPEITTASFTQGGAGLPLPNGPLPNITNVPTLSSLYLTVSDPVNPQNAPFGTPSALQFSALDPATASNVSNYSLINVATNTDESQFISTATFVAQSPTVDSAGYVTSYNGYVYLTFTPGLPTGSYEFIAHTHELQYPGLADAAGNYLDDTSVVGEGTRDFILNFAIQSVPTYITSMALENNYSPTGSTAVGGIQSYFELPPSTGTNTRDNVPAAPNTVVIDLSNPIPFANYSPDVLLVRSANSPTSPADGDFGNLGEGGLGATGTGFTIVPGSTVTLYNYSLTSGTSTLVQAGGQGNRLVLQIAAGTTLPADNYRIYMPNQVDAAGNDTRIFDIYGNQLDGEFLGNQTPQASPDFPGVPSNVSIPEYQNEQANGVYRMNDMSGDGVAGGAFMTGFTVVPYGNVVFARPDYVENPLIPSSLSNGSMANPYPVLAPEGDPNSALAANPTHNPNLGLNNPAFFQPGNFNSAYDFSGDGKYEQSALYAASQLSYNGPVVVVLLPGLPSRNPITGAVIEASYTLVAPSNNTGGSGGSASVPFDTTMVLTPGVTVKLQNAALFVQNQGSALESLGTSTNPVTFTSYNDASVGGATNNNPDTTPYPGDWGGVVFRNYDNAVMSQQMSNFPVDGSLVGLNGAAAVSGAQDAMSILNFTDIRYAGGSVPTGKSDFYSGITLYNSRPMLTNDTITFSGGTGGTEGAIGADFNSLREDDTARGFLVRNDVTSGNSLNGIYLFAESNGLVQPTSATTANPNFPTNPSSLGGSVNYTLEAPLPYIIVAQLVVGQELIENTGGETQYVTNRLYIQPGSVIKFDKGSGLDVLNPGASLNVGSRSYINGFDANSSYSPSSPNFVEESANDPQVLFTSIYNDAATTPFVPALEVFGKPSTTTLGPSLWGSVGIITGAVSVINDATFEYGGGALNTQSFTIDSQSVLAFITGLDVSTFPLPPTWDPTTGTHAYITNNNFFDNFDAAMQIEPNGLLAGDPLRPLLSGHPFFRGNVMTGNGIDGLSVVTARVYYVNPATNYSYIGPAEGLGVPAPTDYVNQTVSAVWDSTDLTYVLRGTVDIGSLFFFANDQGLPVPDTTAFTTEIKPTLSLTIQAALPGTVLADGETIPSPGQSVIVKLLSDKTPNGQGSLSTFGSTGAPAIPWAGAGFVAGVDDGVDPTGSALIDPGAYSEIRNPRHSWKPDDWPAARAGDHDLAPRRHGRYDGPGREDVRHPGELPGLPADCQPEPAHEFADDADGWRWGIHLRRRQLVD